MSVFSVSIRTACHHIFLTFCIHTIPLACWHLLTPLCWQFLASLLRTLVKDLALFWDPLSGTPYHYPSEKNDVLQLLKRNLRPIYLKFICAEVQNCVLVSVCVIQEVCVCVCACGRLSVSLFLPLCLSGIVHVCVRNMLVCVCAFVRKTVYGCLIRCSLM